MIDRFAGSCEAFATVDVAGLARWIGGISFEDWPQQSRVELKPAMVTDLDWHGFGEMAAPVVADLMEHYPGCEPYNLMLSAVMPGHAIDLHKDQQAEDWRCRVHVPLKTNKRSRFIVACVAHVMTPGTAYRVNTLAEHAVTNHGSSARIHMMFDVRSKS